jgi:hypothetical protein
MIKLDKALKRVHQWFNAQMVLSRLLRLFVGVIGPSVELLGNWALLAGL